MSFDTIKTYLTDRLEGLGYFESKSPFTFDEAPVTEYDKSFIIMPINGKIDPDGANLNICLYDRQEWQVRVAFSKSTHNDVINRDDMLRSIEAIIKDIDNADNFEPTIEYIRYVSWEISELSNHFLLIIRFEVRDKYTY